MSFEVAKELSLPVLRMPIGVPVDIQIHTAIKVSTQKMKPRPAQSGQPAQAEKAADICVVSDLNNPDGGRMTLVCNIQLKSVLEDEYPNAGYVGKFFRITKGKKAEGKSWNPMGVLELRETKEKK